MITFVDKEEIVFDATIENMDNSLYIEESTEEKTNESIVVMKNSKLDTNFDETKCAVCYIPFSYWFVRRESSRGVLNAETYSKDHQKHKSVLCKQCISTIVQSNSEPKCPYCRVALKRRLPFTLGQRKLFNGRCNYCCCDDMHECLKVFMYIITAPIWIPVGFCIWTVVGFFYSLMEFENDNRARRDDVFFRRFFVLAASFVGLIYLIEQANMGNL
jgi:hypothetical protein